MASRETLLKILDLARWAPSGDNTQPWRFEIVSDKHLAIHGNDTRDWCVYDFNGHASHMAHGALLETLRIAATGEGLSATWSRRAGSSDRSRSPLRRFTFSATTPVRFSAAPGFSPAAVLLFFAAFAAPASAGRAARGRRAGVRPPQLGRLRGACASRATGAGDRRATGAGGPGGRGTHHPEQPEHRRRAGQRPCAGLERARRSGRGCSSACPGSLTRRWRQRGRGGAA